MSWLEGKSREEWNEFWRRERLREDEMLDFWDEVGGNITGKALAEKFDLRVGRVNRLIRSRRESRERKHLFVKIEQLEQETFTSLAERLWMDLGWLAMELERRKKAPQGDWSNESADVSSERPAVEASGP